MKKLYETKIKYTLKEHLTLQLTFYDRSISTILLIIFAVMCLLSSIVVHRWDLILWALFALYVPPLLLTAVAAYVYKTGKNIQNKIITVEIYKDYIMQKTDISEYKLENDKIWKVIKNKNYYYILASRQQAIIIPRKDLPKDIEQHIIRLYNIKK